MAGIEESLGFGDVARKTYRGQSSYILGKCGKNGVEKDEELFSSGKSEPKCFA